jgi:uncharacterized cupredoxin-like copper-binding protein
VRKMEKGMRKMEDGRWKMMSLRAALVGATIAAVLLTAAACGDDDDDDDDAAATETPEATEASATPDGEDGDASASPTVAPVDTTAAFALDEWAVKPEKTRSRRGTVTFEVRNEGEFAHQFLVIRTDIEKDELPRKPEDAGADETDLDVVGRIDSIEPGASDQVEVDVEEGQYVIICNLESNGNSHYLNGMYNEFEVTATAPVDSPTPFPTQ